MRFKVHGSQFTVFGSGFAVQSVLPCSRHPSPVTCHLAFVLVVVLVLVIGRQWPLCGRMGIGSYRAVSGPSILSAGVYQLA